MDYKNPVASDLESILYNRKLLFDSKSKIIIDYVANHDISINKHIDASYIELDNTIDNVSDRISDLSSNVNSSIVDLYNIIGTSVNDVILKVSGLSELVNSSLVDLTTTFNASINDLYRSKDTINSSISSINSSLTLITTNVDSSFSSLKLNIDSSFGNLKLNVDSSFSTLKLNLDSSFGDLKQNVDTSFGDLKKNLDSSFSDLKQNVDTSFGDLKKNLDSSFSDLKQNVDSSFSSLKETVDTSFTLLYTDISTLIDASLSSLQLKVDGSINALDISVADLYEDFNTLVDSSNANGVIDTFKEVESFLNSISDASTLTGILKDERTNTDSSFTTFRSNLDSSLSTMRSNTDSSFTTFRSNLDSSLSTMQSNIDSSIATLKLTIDSSLKVVLDEYIKDVSATNVFNSSVLSGYTNSSIATISVKDETDNTVTYNIPSLLNIKDLYTDISTLRSNMNSSLQNINSSIDNLDVLNTSYVNSKNKFTEAGITNVGSALNFIIDTLYYTAPADVNVTYTVSPTSFTKGKNTAVTFTYTINNYKDSIKSITYNGTALPITTLTKTETVTVSDTVSRSLVVNSSYIDSKDATPKAYSATKTATANLELYYWTDTSTSYATAYTASNKPDWKTYTHSSSAASINCDNAGVNKYIYFVYNQDLSESAFFVYTHGSSPTLSGGITKLGSTTIKLYDTSINYYLYRTTQLLGGNYDIKF